MATPSACLSLEERFWRKLLASLAEPLERGAYIRLERYSVRAGRLLQRLFSTFPDGLPGAGLALLRAAAAVPLAHAGLLTVASSSPVPLEVVTGGAAILLLIGLWTPLAGSVIAVAELALAVFHPVEPWMNVHFAAMGAALAMLGPGCCSVDARLFGRKQIRIPRR